jgi:hypothetical protein
MFCPRHRLPLRVADLGQRVTPLSRPPDVAMGTGRAEHRARRDASGFRVTVYARLSFAVSLMIVACRSAAAYGSIGNRRRGEPRGWSAGSAVPSSDGRSGKRTRIPGGGAALSIHLSGCGEKATESSEKSTGGVCRLQRMGNLRELVFEG